MRICSRSLTLLAAQLVSSAWRLGGPQVEGRTRRGGSGGRGCQPPTTCSTSSLLSPATGPKKEWKRGETKSEKEEKEREMEVSVEPAPWSGLPAS